MNMQLLFAVTLLICLTTVLSFEEDDRKLETDKQNEIDNSVNIREPINENGSGAYGLKTYGESGSYIGTDQSNEIIHSTVAPSLQEDVQPMPMTGCIGHLPLPEENNNLPENINQPPRSLIGPVPPQFNPENTYGRPMYNPTFESQQYYPNHNFPHHFPHHHHPHFPQSNPWSPWRRNMNFVSDSQPFYPQQNPWSPWRRQSPFVMPPTAPQFFPQNGVNRPPLVIVKLLQPIILPVAKPLFPEGGDRDPDSEDVDSQKAINTGDSQKFMSGRPHHRMGFRRFDEERVSSYGPYKINGENVHISVKLH